MEMEAIVAAKPRASGRCVTIENARIATYVFERRGSA
jgi:hypothetical protein